MCRQMECFFFDIIIIIGSCRVIFIWCVRYCLIFVYRERYSMTLDFSCCFVRAVCASILGLLSFFSYFYIHANILRHAFEHPRAAGSMLCMNEQQKADSIRRDQRERDREGATNNIKRWRRRATICIVERILSIDRNKILIYLNSLRLARFGRFFNEKFVFNSLSQKKMLRI